MRYFISAGEASGDIHAAQLIEALRRHDPESEFTFLGGDLMAAAAGSDPLIHYRDMAYMGYVEVIRHLPQVLGNLSKARETMLAERPDILILVDYPSFNLKLAKAAKEAGIPVAYFISPKVWAWKEGRVKDIKKYVDLMLSILPFEVDFYRRRHNYGVTYVGNPSVGEVDARLKALPPREEFLREHSLSADKPLLALLPGSRMGEIRGNLPIMDDVAARHPEFQAVIAGAPSIAPEVYARHSALPVVFDDTFRLVAYSHAAVVTSGTATLETALIGTPQVACYRSNGWPLTYALFKRILKIPYVTLPNLIADRCVIPELLIHHCNADEIDEALIPLLDSESRTLTAMKSGYDEIRRRLTDADAADAAARLIIQKAREARKG